MRKTLGAVAVATALMAGGGHLWAMDYRLGIQLRTDGGWSPVQFRYSDYSDERAQTAHVLEVDGEPVSFYGQPVGDKQVLGYSNSYGSSGGADYESGFALWSGSIAARQWTPLFQATSNNGAFSFGARFTIKNKERDGFAGNGFSVWLDYKNFELKIGTTGGLGYGAYVGTGGTFYGQTAALFGWELGSGSYLPYFTPGNYENLNYFGYQVSNAGLSVENISDRATGMGIKWTQRLRGTDTLDVRLVNMFRASSKGFSYTAGDDYDALLPVGWNFQVNYRMPAWTFATTFKVKDATNSGEKFEIPKAVNISWHIAALTTIFPGMTLSAGYGLIGEFLGDAQSAVDETNYDKEFWGHNAEITLAFPLGDWTLNFGSKTTLFLLSDEMKARSSANRYGWRPYLGETVSLSAHKRINGLLTGHIAVGFDDANMNSYTDGKAEASIWLSPSVDISPARGVTVTVGLSASLQNFSDQARGWWSDYNSDYDPFGAGSEIYYTYPHTLHISVPISCTISI